MNHPCRRGLLGPLLLALAALPAVARAQAPCEIEIEPVWAEAEQLKLELENDAFAAAFGQFIKDLADNAEELERWKVDARRHVRDICLPHQQDIDAFDARAATFTARGCSGTITDADLYAWCVAEHGALQARDQAIRDRYDATVKPSEDRLNSWGQDMLAKERRAVERARDMLDPGKLEPAFRLYAFSVARDVAAGRVTSCEAMARMADALAARTGDQYGRHLMLMGRVLASQDNPLVFEPGARSVSFNASGFKRRYVGPPGALYDRANQVRHTVAYLMAGADFSGVGATLLTYMQDRVRHQLGGRVPEEHDYLLGVAAGRIGGNLRLHTLGAGQLGNALRAELCGI